MRGVDEGVNGRSALRRLVVGAAIVDDLDAPRSLLAARRSSPPALAGLWEFPGGKVEPGEDPQEALCREMREELGVEIEIGDEVPGPEDFGMTAGGVVIGHAWPLTPAIDDRAFVLRLWFARITAGEPKPLEDHDRVRWLGPGEWRDVPWVDGDRPIVETLIADAVKRNRLGWC